MINRIILMFCLLAAGNIIAAVPELVTVGDAGNPGREVTFGEIPKPFPRGSVSYPYRIGKNEVSNAEYAEFLNACAAKNDPHRLFDERMKIVRSGEAGAWRYAPQPGSEQSGVSFVSKVNAARYCNYLTTGDPAKGAYVIAERIRENGKVYEAIVGCRDLTFPEAARVWYLPDMHEFFKAGWYDGDGKYRELTPATRNEKSHYGILGHASGQHEHIENKAWGVAAFLLGADEKSSDAAALNTAHYWVQPEIEGRGDSGFRVAATAPLQFGNRLNRRNNFFFERSEPAKLRIRNDGPVRDAAFQLELRDFANRPVWSERLNPKLKNGVNELVVKLPEKDGYYELLITPEDPLFNGQSQRIPLAVMNDPCDNGAEGNFGFYCHIIRMERRNSFEECDFDLLRRLGVSNVRERISFDDVNGSQSVLRRLREAGLNPLALIEYSDIAHRDKIAANRGEFPELIDKWAKHGIPADYAWFAEKVYNLVAAYRDVVRDWEVGNEPTYWDCLPEDYAQALKAGYKAAKLADPKCNVMAGDIGIIHAPVFRMKGGDFCDSIANHIYGFYTPEFGHVAGKMRELNGWKKAAGIPAKPVWLTEIGVCTYNSMHLIPVRTFDEVRRYQALSQPKLMAGAMAFGASKVLPYNFRDQPLDFYEEEFGMVDRFGLPKPAVASFRATAKLLGRAKFAGFVKGHSMKIGKIAGLAFKDQEGRSVLTFWRNDPYGYRRYETPFLEMIKPAQTVRVAAAGNSVELFDLSGGASKLPVKNGAVEIPVDEYPVFVRGALSPELEEVATAHRVPVRPFPAAKVRILPNSKSRACDIMSGVTLNLIAGMPETTVQVHVYNLRSEPLKGTLRVIPKHRWHKWPWAVRPAAIPLEIPADGMGEGRFTVPVPRDAKPGQHFYIDAVFECAGGMEFSDTVGADVVEKTFSLKEWITSSHWFHFAADDDNRQIRINWEKNHPNTVTFFLRRPELFAINSEELNRDVTIPAQVSGAEISAVNLLFLDRNGETFQLRRNLKLAEKGWNPLRFNAAGILQKDVIVHRGGNGQVDFPIRLLGFSFDIRNTKPDGFILLKPYEITTPTPRWEPGAWAVYGKGYQLLRSPGDKQAVIQHTPGGRAYVSLFSTRHPVLAEDGKSWPKTVTVTFRPEGSDITAASFLVQDEKGEIFQIRQPLKAKAGAEATARFDLSRFPAGKGLIIFEGNRDRKLDYPVKLLGFNFDFKKGGSAGTLTVKPPEFDSGDGDASPARPSEVAPGDEMDRPPEADPGDGMD